MKEVFKLILERIGQGKIEKQTGVQLINILKAQNDKKHTEIAVIGMALNLPMAGSTEEFWDNILNKADCVKTLPRSRASDITRYLKFKGMPEESIAYHELGYLDEIDGFDYAFFRLSPKEASLMDPHQRLFLETAWHAIEDAGYGGKRIAGTRTGVYVGFEGALLENYGGMVYQVDPSSGQIAIPSNLPSIIPGRLSYLLDIKGPSMLVDSACSSSLVAVDLACQALNGASCNMALVGGVRINLVPLCRDVNLGIEAKDGRTRAFDHNTEGSGEGEGVAAVILKPLNNALEDGDNIYAVIKGSAVNQDGNSAGITAPNPAAHADVIIKAWEKAGIDPSTLAYIETHGTGTRIGDPIELKGIKNAFRRYTDRKQFCAISSVKPNIGHLYECSGIVSLIKAVLALKNGCIPPTAYFNVPNREIDFSESPVYINTRPRKWEKSSAPKRCAVNSFGISGTNCHVVLEDALIKMEYNEKKNSEPRILTLSALCESSLARLVEEYKRFISEKDLDIDNLCYTASTGRGHYNCRIAFLAESKEELSGKLHAVDLINLREIPEAGIYYGNYKTVEDGRPVLREDEITSSARRELTTKAGPVVERYIENGDAVYVKELCRLYAKGADVDWERFYKNKKLRKISLPMYPFYHRRCWVDVPLRPADESLEDAFYRISWRQREERSGEEESPVLSGRRILLFKDTTGTAEKIAAYLRKEGILVTEVEFGECFKKVDKHKYVINGDEEDYGRLLKELGQNSFSQVVHLSSLANVDEPEDSSVLGDRQKKGFYSILYFVRAMAANGYNTEISLAIITANAYEVTGNEKAIHPENAAIIGIGKVIPSECPAISCRCIDAECGMDESLLLKEIINTGGESYVAYRDGKSYSGVLEKVDPDSLKDRPINIKDDGVYIITGGAGGIGLETARYLAGKAKVKIAAICRSGFPHISGWESILAAGSDKNLCEKISKIKEIVSSGSELHFYKADISDYELLSEVMDSIRKNLGPITGVIHGAGVAGRGLAAEKEMRDISEVMAPKVSGTWNLEKLTSPDKLDFFIMYSSIASLMGEPGQADYASANAYMDSAAYPMMRKGIKALTINWAPWKETGMWLKRGRSSDTIFEALPTEQAIRALDTVIGKEIGNVIVGKLNYLHNEIGYFIEHCPYRISSEINNKIKAVKEKRGFKTNAAAKPKDFRLAGRIEENAYTPSERKAASIWNEVFGLQEVNIYDNFYEMGGDSIKGLKIVNLINKELGLNLKISDLLTHLSIFEFARFIDQEGIKPVKGTSLYTGIKPVGKMEYYPLSSAQRRVFIMSGLIKGDTRYNITRVFEIQGVCDLKRLSNAVSQIVKRHESLRSGFAFMGGQPVQKIYDEVNVGIEYSEAEGKEIHLLVKEFVKPYDLSVLPLFRVKVIKMEEGKHMLILDMHHIITDGASMDIVIEELAKLYRGEVLPAPILQYKDYAVWQNEMIKDAASPAVSVLKAQEKYWLERFKGEIPSLTMPTDYSRMQTANFEGSQIRFSASMDISKKINDMARKNGISLYMLLLAAYNTLLCRYSGNEDIIVGSPVVGRPCASLEGVIGMFVNTLPMRNFPSGKKTFTAFLNEVRECCLDAYKNQDYQFDDIVNKLNRKRDISRNPLFDTMFSLQNVGVRQFEIEGMRFIPYEYDSGTAKFDLNLEAVEMEGKIEFRLEYRTDLFKKETVERIAEDFIGMLEFLSGESEIKLGEIPLRSCKDSVIIRHDAEDIEFNF